MTKTYEEVRRGGLRELAAWAGEGVRGEVRSWWPAPRHPSAAEATDLVAEVQTLVGTGTRLKEATAAVAAAHGVSRRELYDAVLAARLSSK